MEPKMEKTTIQISQTVSIGNYRSRYHRKTEVIVNRLILDHNKLKGNLHKIMPKFYPSPLCACGTEEETANHILLNCSLHTVDRIKMIHQIEIGFIKTDTPLDYRKIDTTTILGLNAHLKPEIQNIISQAVDRYISVAKFDI